MAKYILTIPEDATGGTFTLNVSGTSTGPIDALGSASDVREAVHTAGEADATVTGAAGGPFTINNVNGTITVQTHELEGSEGAVTVDLEAEESTGGSNTVPGQNFEKLRAAQGKLIRKALGGFIMVAPMEVEMPENIMADAEGNLIDFKAAGFEPVGWLTKGDGINFSRETETSEVESFGAQEPTRIDITKDTNSAAFTCQETNRQVMELFYGKDLSELTMDENGEFAFTPDNSPETIYRRVIYIAKDGNGPNAKFIAKKMPRAMVSETGEQSWSSENELSYGLTMRASMDGELGYAVEHRFGGPGFLKLAEDMGIPLASAA